MRPGERDRSWSATIVALGLLAVALLAFQIFKVSLRTVAETDLRYVWLAGDFWGSRLNPYGADFIPRSIDVYGQDARVSFWVYPFQWYWISRPLALLSPTAALHVWQVTSYLLLALGSVLTIRASAKLGAHVDRLTMLALAIYALSFTALAGLLQLAQPVMLSVFGFAALVYGLAAAHDVPKLIGIVLLALKPQFGLPILLLIATMPGGLRLCVIGGVITAALAVPPLLVSGFGEQIGGMIGNVTAGYDDVPVNWPISMVGLPNILALLAGIDMSVGVGLLVASAASLGIGIALRRSTRLTAADKITYATAAAALTVACLVGVHPYDLVVLLIPLPLLLRQARAARWVGLAGYLLLWRHDHLGRIMGLDGLSGSITLASIAVFLIAASWMLDATWRLRSAD